MVAVATQHVLSSDDVLFLKAAVSKVQQWLIFLYGADFLTPTSHWTLHIPMFVERYGTPRGYWTFPQESILSLAKKSTRKMTNHRAVSYTCVRLFVLERLLQQLLDPLAVIPKKFFFSLSKIKKMIIIIIIRSQDLPLKGKHWENLKEYTALEIARREEHDVVALLEGFTTNQTLTCHEIQVKLGLLDEVAAEVFALTVFLCDDLFQLKPALANPAEVAFKSLARSLIFRERIASKSLRIR